MIYILDEKQHGILNMYTYKNQKWEQIKIKTKKKKQQQRIYSVYNISWSSPPSSYSMQYVCICVFRLSTTTTFTVYIHSFNILLNI